MGKRTKAKSPNNNTNNNVGKGKVTPVQVAFIVDRYLADNNFSNTRSAFRSEASSLIPKSSLHEAPKSLLSLGELLDEYIWLKEQKFLIEQEKCELGQERCRVQTLFQGMQDLMTAFNSPPSVAGNCLTPSPPPALPSGPVPRNSGPVSTSGGFSAYRTPVMTSVSMAQSMQMDQTKFSTPLTGSRSHKKRKNYKVLQQVHEATKRYQIGPVPNSQFLNKGSNSVVHPNIASVSDNNAKQLPPLQSSSPDFAHGGLLVQGSIAKNLFNKPSTSPNSHSSGPKTPPRAVSSQSDKSISPLEDVSSTAKSHHSNTPSETTPTNCTIISSKTIIVSPDKRYSIERNQCTFSSPAKSNVNRQSKREHVKGRLDFDSSDAPTSFENTSGDGSSTSESEKEGDIFDLDLTNFDAFGPDFSLTELLTDFGIDCGTVDYSCPTTAGAITDAVPESVYERNNRELGTRQDLIEHSSAVTEVVAGDRSINGVDSITSVKSVRKCITIVSPSKRSRMSSVHEQENLNRTS